jgi:capsular exopolysaccharide synthesis family protein
MSAADRLGQAIEGDRPSNVLDALRRRWPIALCVVVGCVAVAVYRHEKSPKSYTASASVAFQSQPLSDVALQVSPSSSSEPIREVNTQVLIAHSPEVASGVRKQLKLPLPPAALLDEVEVEAVASADVLRFNASAGDPQTSAKLANAFAEQYIVFKTQSQLSSIATAETELQHQILGLQEGSSEKSALQQSLQRLSELRAVASSGANIIGRATPPVKPSGTSLSSTIVIGLLIGLATSFSLTLLLESLDKKVKSIEEFEHEYRLPALTSVPQLAIHGLGARERKDMLEPYRILRSSLDFAGVTKALDTLLVTSAASGEGKTTVAVDLAHAVALAGRKTMLVELDLRRPTFSQHFDIAFHEGFTDAVFDVDRLSELGIRPFADMPNFSVLPAGRLPHNPSELLGSPSIAEIISRLAKTHDMVIIDAPPLNPVADTQVLLNNSAIHAALIVARVDRTTRVEIRRARSILDHHMVEPVGMVVTGLRNPTRYGYEAYEANGPIVDLAGPSLSRPQSNPISHFSRWQLQG